MITVIRVPGLEFIPHRDKGMGVAPSNQHKVADLGVGEIMRGALAGVATGITHPCPE